MWHVACNKISGGLASFTRAVFNDFWVGNITHTLALALALALPDHAHSTFCTRLAKLQSIGLQSRAYNQFGHWTWQSKNIGHGQWRIIRLPSRLTVWLSGNSLVSINVAGPKNPFLCPRGRVALSCGRDAHGGRTNASCGPFAQWPERYHGCEQWRIHRGGGGGGNRPPPEWEWSVKKCFGNQFSQFVVIFLFHGLRNSSPITNLSPLQDCVCAIRANQPTDNRTMTLVLVSLFCVRRIQTWRNLTLCSTCMMSAGPTPKRLRQSILKFSRSTPTCKCWSFTHSLIT